MNSDQQGTATDKKRSSGKKKALIALLILSVAAGCIVGAYLLYASSGFGSSVKKGLDGFAVKNLSDLSSLLQEKVTQKAPDIVLTFQGTLLGEEGAIAIINDQMVAAGATIEGVRITSIDNRKLVIDYQGEVQTLTIGETISIHQD